jgi:hypothetical protein
MAINYGVDNDPDCRTPAAPLAGKRKRQAAPNAVQLRLNGIFVLGVVNGAGGC